MKTRNAIAAIALVLFGFVAAACGPPAFTLPPFPASPYFANLHTCRDTLGQDHIFIEPKIDGFYTMEVWQFGVVGTVNEGGAVEVLRGDPPRIHFIVSTLPYQIVWKARGGDNWQPASRQYVDASTTPCNFI